MNAEHLLEVLVVSPQRLIYQGRADRVVLPGEKGVFEVLPHHKRLLSRLLPGFLIVDTQAIQIKRGVAKVGLNQITILVEES